MTPDETEEFFEELDSDSAKTTSNYLLAKEKLNAATANALDSAFNFGYMVGYDAAMEIIKNKYGAEFVEELISGELGN